MNNDILELLADLEEFISGAGYFDDLQGGVVPDTELVQWIEQKRSEYAEPKGDCCG